MFLTHSSLAAPLAALLALFAAPAAHAAALTWDAGNTNNGTAIDPASGDWNTTAANLVWNNAGANVPWTQTSPTAALNSAIFGGVDGTLDSYVVTLGAPMAASALTFNNTGYKITGSTLQPGSITVASGKTATINSTLSLVSGANHTINGTLNLGGGNGANNNNIQWNSTGTLNLNAGTYTLSNQRFNLPAWNQTGGTVNLGGSSGSGSWIGYQGTVRNVNMTVSGGLFNNNGSAGAYLGIGRAWSGATATLTIKTGGTVNFGNLTDGNLVISQDGTADTAKLDVQGGNLTVGTGAAANKITLFNGAANALKNALMTQSGGTVTANGIQFGAGSGTPTIDPSALATLQLSGGNLYVGQLGITKGAGAATLNYLIQLQGGTLGASVNWSSALDMALGTAGGGVTIQAADAANVARNITLSGSIADDTAVNGPLTKTGSGTLTLSGTVSYTGPTLVSAGKLLVPATATATGAVTNNATLGVTASGTSQWSPASLRLANPCTLEFNSVQNPGTTTAPLLPGTTVGTVAGVTVNVNSISGAVAVGDSYPLLGQVSATNGYTLGTQPPGVTGRLAVSGGSTLVYIVQTVADLWTGADGTNPTWWDIGTTVNWTGRALSNPTPGTYVNGDAVAFDDMAGTNTVELRANVAPGNMLFANITKDYLVSASGAFGISGSGTLTKSGAGTATLSCPVSYSGIALVSAGKLVFGSTHTGTGAATVSANAALGVTALGVSQWQPASLTLANPCTLEFNSVQNPGTTTAPLRPTAAVGTVSGVTININSFSGAVAIGNSYPLLGNQSGTTNGYALGVQPPGVTGRLAASGTTLVYIVETATDIWTGADGTFPTWWDIGTTANWTGKALINSPAGTYANGDNVLFNDTAIPASPVAVELQANVAPGNIVFNSTKAYTVSASGAFGIGGSGTLTKSGTGTVTLGTDNSYASVTTINSVGASASTILTVANNNALGSTAGGTIVYGSATSGGGSTVNLADGITVTDETLTLDPTTNGYRATLQIASGMATWDGNVVLAGTNGLTIFNANGSGAYLTVGSSAADTVTGNRGLFIRGTGIGTINSSIQLTSGGLSTADGGTWTLFGNNDYPGDTGIGSGGSRLQLGADNRIPDGVGKGNVILNISGGRFDLNTWSETINGLTGVAGTFVETAAGGTPTLTVGNYDATSTFSGVIRDTLSLAKIASGTLTLTAANSYSGDTTISGGTLTIGASGSLGSGTYAGNITNNASLQYSSSAAQTLSGNIIGSGSLTKDTGTGTLTLSGSTINYSGATVVSAGKLVVLATATAANTVTVSANATLGVTASGTSQWSPASLLLANPCTLEFNDVQNPGTTTAPLRPTAAVGTVSGVTININSLSGAVAVNNSYPLLGNQGGTTNGYTLGTQPGGVTGRLAVSGSTLVYIVETLADLWTGADGFSPTWWDIATTANWTLKALNNPFPGTYVDGDSVFFDDSAAPASPVSVELLFATVAPGNMVFNNSSKAYTVSGAFGIGGSGTLTKSGTGGLTLGTDNSYSGTTTVNSGVTNVGATLTVAHNHALGSTAGGTIVYGANTTGDGSRVNLADGITVTDETLTLDAGPVGLRASLVTSGTATWDGNVVVTGVNTQQIAFIANGAGANLTVGASAADTVTGSRSFSLRGTGNGTMNSSVQIGANGINKSDSGTWTLAGNNTYTGNTTVGGGTLAFTLPTLATNSTVSVSGSGVLQLEFAETNIVAGFVTNGVSLPAGVYSAANVAPFIAGWGSLEVVVTGPSGPATLTNSVSGGVLSLSWPAGQGWRLQSQTNPLTVGLGTNWVEAAGSSVSSTNITIDSTKPTVFYRLVWP